MDGKRYLYSAPVVDVKIAAPPRASRDGDKQQKEHTLLSRRAGRVNPRYPPDRPRPNPTPKENPIEQVSRRRFCCFFRWCAVCSWVGWRRGRRARGAAANQRGPYQIQQAGRGSPAGLAAAGARQIAGRGGGAGAGETCSNRRSGLPRCRWGARAGAWTPDEGVCSMLMAWRGWRRRWRLGWAWAWRSCYVGTCRLRLFVCAVGPLGQACHLRTECFPMPGLAPRTGREH